MLEQLPRPIIFAHRGASAYAPENTIAAFELAVQQGADAIELDVKLCKDGIPVVIHDRSLARTTGAPGRIDELPLTELRQLDAGSFFSTEYRGEKIPTLEEVFKAVGQKLFINVELTNYSTPLDTLVPRVVELIKECKMQDRVLFSSFYPFNLAKAKVLLPQIPSGLLSWTGWLGWWGRAFGFRSDVYHALHPNLKDVDAGLVARVQAAGRRVHVWTVNAGDDMRRLTDWGVDGIFTDDPLLARQVIGRGRHDST